MWLQTYPTARPGTAVGCGVGGTWGPLGEGNDVVGAGCEVAAPGEVLAGAADEAGRGDVEGFGDVPCEVAAGFDGLVVGSVPPAELPGVVEDATVDPDGEGPAAAAGEGAELRSQSPAMRARARATTTAAPAQRGVREVLAVRCDRSIRWEAIGGCSGSQP
jgi:hypothetical protein